jgi:hypothetical protein
MKYIGKSVFSVILVFCILFTGGSLQVFAKDSIPDQSVSDPQTDRSDNEETKINMKLPDDMDFSTKRLVLIADKEDITEDGGEIIAAYDDLYIIQYESETQCMEAYAYYSDKVTAVEPDAVVEAADNVSEEEKIKDNMLTGQSSEDQGSDSGAEEANDDICISDADIEVTVNENPFDMLANTEDISHEEQNGSLIALLDTGAEISENVIEQVSMIGDESVSANNKHGENMAAAIISQNPNAKILSVRVLDDNGRGTVSSIAAGIEYALSQKAAYINLSLYAKNSLATSVIAAQIRKAVENGAVVIGAAGNDAQDVSGYIPGSVEEAYVIGAADENGKILGTSNYGETVDYYVKAANTSEAAALFTGYISANGIEALPDSGAIFAPNDTIVSEGESSDWISRSKEEIDKMVGINGAEAFIAASTETIIYHYTYYYEGAASAVLRSPSGGQIYCILPWSKVPSGHKVDFVDYAISSQSDANLQLMAKLMYYGYGGGGNILGNTQEAEAITHFALSKIWIVNMGNSHGGPSWTSSGGGKLSETGQAATNNFIASVQALPNVKGTLHIASYYQASGEAYQDLAYGEFIPEISKGWLKIQKYSSAPEITDGNDCYSLAGAVYGIYSDSACKQKVGEVVTDTNGTSNAIELEADKDYYIKELSAPKGYAVNSTTGNMRVIADSTVTYDTVDIPEYAPGQLDINKLQRGKQSDTIPSLAGTQFTVTFYGGQFKSVADAEKAASSSSTAKRTWVFEVKKQESGSFGLHFSEEYKVSGDIMYYHDGKVVMPYGTYVIEESKAAPGYTLAGRLEDTKGNVVASSSDNNKGIVYLTNVTKTDGTVKLSGGNEYDSYDIPVEGKIKVIKYASDGTSLLQGVSFILKDSKGNKTAEGVTDANGEIIFTGLYPDVYTLIEISTVGNNMLLADPITIRLPMSVSIEEAEKLELDTSKEGVVFVSESIAADGSTTEAHYLLYGQTYEIKNTPAFSMPFTGGSGSWIPGYACAVLVPVIIGAHFFIKKKEIIS